MSYMRCFIQFIRQAIISDLRKSGPNEKKKYSSQALAAFPLRFRKNDDGGTQENLVDMTK